MKFSKIGQVSLVSGIALILASTFTACNPVTIDYVFVAGDNQTTSTTPTNGEIQTFLSDRVSGALSPVNTKVSSGGVRPVSVATSTDYQHLYVANQDDSTIVEFTIDGSGKLTSTKTTTLSAEGNTPVAIAMNAAGTLLYVANRYQPGHSSASPSAGALAVFPVGKDGSLGASVTNGGLNYVAVGVNPTSVNALSTGAAAYVTTYNPTAGLGFIYGFSATSGGALATLTGSPFAAGVKPSAITSDPTGRFVYATDFSQSQLIGYSVIDQAVLHPLINGPFRTGSQPTALTIDPRGRYIYLTNSLDNTVSAYSIDLATGTPTTTVSSTGTSNLATGTQPVAILVDPGYGRYVYTANYLDNSLTGFKLDGSTGALTLTLNGPYPSINQPAAVASVPRGNHSVQVNQD